VASRACGSARTCRRRWSVTSPWCAVFNPTGEFVAVSGVRQPLRPRILHREHPLQLFELHPDDAKRLQHWARRDRRVKIQRDDGFAGLKAILPPAEKRALVDD